MPGTVPTTRPIRIGQLGIGHNHGTEQMRSLRKLGDDFTVVGLVEDDPDWRRKRGADPAYRGLPWLTEEQLLADPEVSAVSVECDVPDLVPTALRCLRAGKHVHLDKPGGESLAAFRDLFAEAAERDLQIQLGYILRHHPAIRFAISAARAGWLGRICSVDAAMSRLDGAEARAHFGRFAGGAMYIFGGYLIDLVISLLGRPDRIVPFQRMTRPEADRLNDNGLAVLEYAQACAVIRTAVVEFDGFNRRNLVVCGDQGTIEIRPIEPVHQAPVPPRVVLNLAKPCGGHPAGRSEVVFPVMGGRYDDQWRHFAAMIRGEGDNPWPPAHELLLHECLLGAAMDACAAEGRPVAVTLDCVGGADLGAHLARMADGGRWVLIATLAGERSEIPLRALLKRGLRLIGSTLRNRPLAMKARVIDGLHTTVWPALAAGTVRPVIHAVLPMAEAASAHAILERGENIGKVVLTLPPHRGATSP